MSKNQTINDIKDNSKINIYILNSICISLQIELKKHLNLSKNSEKVAFYINFNCIC